MKNYTINIGWLYPELMSTYGDRGNIMVIKKRSEQRSIQVNVIEINHDSPVRQLHRIDMFFGGGAQDKEQEIVMRDLGGTKGEVLKEKVEIGIPALMVCGAYQLAGKFYVTAQGIKINGLGILDITTIHGGIKSKRFIGNIAVKSSINGLESEIIVGFENHGGRTYLGENANPFAKVVKGYGNNGEDKTEGVILNNTIGTYLHGPILPKNPKLADYLIQKALEVKYKDMVTLDELDDKLEEKARKAICQKLGINC